LRRRGRKQKNEKGKAKKKDGFERLKRRSGEPIRALLEFC
jgi:hypothetical protein